MNDQGFEIHPDVLASEEVAALSKGLEEAPIERSRAGARHLLRTPAVATVARDARLLAMAGRALGTEACPFRATLFTKSPRSNWLVVWHQDTALPLRERREVPGWGPWSVKAGVTYAHAPADALSRIVALRVHLDDSTAANGPLRVLPGTHRLGVLSDERVHELASSIPASDCTVPRGGIVVMRPLLVHASSKAASADPRRVVHIEYAASLALGSELELRVA
jgi:ectoine hydroxylase-related dioxygenase (phytanoyl-CoA dioxygenase family)